MWWTVTIRNSTVVQTFDVFTDTDPNHPDADGIAAAAAHTAALARWDTPGTRVTAMTAHYDN